VRILFGEKISIKGIKSSDINSSNTEVEILPYINQITGNFLNLSKYNLTWNTTQLTEKELEIQIDFEEPDSISR
jgi:hypothetical protein